MERFDFHQPTRIHFGAGRLEEIGTVVKKYGDSCLLVTTSMSEKVLAPLYDRIKMLLSEEGIKVYHFDEVVPNPTIGCIEKGIGIVNEHNIPVVLAVGGGSSIDTAKSIALFYKAGQVDWQRVFGEYTSPFAEYEPISDPILPVIAVPTTAGTGSELTQAMVISDPDNAQKMCIFHDKVFPRETVIDPELMRTLPPYMTAVTGFDAFSHAFESYMRESSSPYTRLVGLKAMEIIIGTLPRLLDSPNDIELREKMALAAMFAGISLGNAAASMPHPLSEIIGGVAPRIPHGQCLATIYPRYITFEAEKQPDKCADIARLFDPSLCNVNNRQAANNLGKLLVEFLEKIGLNKTLKELGVTSDEMEQITDNFLLDVLPFAPKDVLVGVLRESY
ncbi:MAG: iron-containing alcohol dehydrogenase [Firmicutes bacterium]|nr:iron-containing alcohol dehydrogenase [Bacillota bacterium]HXL04375.1 iron-containing alcohol dehydrogenase [Bacillota bacterium]